MIETTNPAGLDPLAIRLVNDRLAAELADAELNALKALARYKFAMFGYHAAQWVLLNRVAGRRLANPFRFLVHEARRALTARGEATLTDLDPTQEPE